MKLSRELIRRALSNLARLRLPDSGGPSEPLIPVRQPRRRGPGDRDAAASVPEPDEDLSTRAIASGAADPHR